MISVNVPGAVVSKMGAYSPKDPGPQTFLKFITGGGHSQSQDEVQRLLQGSEKRACE